jgi:hypothetical protein
MAKKQKTVDTALSEYREIVGIMNTISALVECQRRIQANERGYHDRVRAHLGATAELALRVTKNKDVWQSFTRQKFWETCEGEKPTLSDRSDGLRFAVRFAESAKTRGAAQNSSRHATIIKYLLDQGIKPVDFLKYLSKPGQGMNAVYEKATAKKASGAKDKSGNGSKHPPSQKGQKSNGSKQNAKDTPQGRVRTVDLTRNFVIEVDDPDRLNRLLRMKQGRVTFEQIGTEPNWVRVRATVAKRLSPSA